MAQTEWGDARLPMGAGGNDEDLGGHDMELSCEDELDFEIASF